MKPLLLTCFTLVLALNAHTLFAQTVTDIEIEYLCEKLALSLNGNSNVDKIIVEDFTDETGKSTALGAYLAQEFSNILVTTPNKSFTVFDRSNLQTTPVKGGNTWTPLANEVVNQSARDGKIDAQTQNGIQAGLGLVNLLTASSNDRRLRGIDAIVQGTVSASDDNYRIIISVKRRRGGELVGGARGYLTKTPALAEKENTSAVGGRNPTGDIVDRFRKTHLTVGLRGCQMSGRYLECNLQLNSEAQDTDLWLYTRETRIIDTNSGKEFYATNLRIADAFGDDNVSKSIIKDIPVDAVVTFDLGNDIFQTASMLQIHFWSNPTGHFYADFRNVSIR